MHDVVVVQFHRGWRATLFYFVDLVAVGLILFAAWAIYELYTLPAPTTPTPAEHITLPDSGVQIPLQKI